jgi:histidinol phosphatase-like enzyme (inositol monophosphatase family)
VTRDTPYTADAPRDGAALLEAVVEVARLAGSVALGYFDDARRATLAVEHKSDGSPVTAADRAAERSAREWIERRFPADGVLGEELGTVRPDATRRWIIDPIDGTKSFVRGVPLWGTLVAVAEGDAVLAGAIHCAAATELVAAAIGQGSWWNGTRCHVSDVADLERATVLATDIREGPAPGRLGAWRRLAERAAIARTWGDAYGYVLVATGRADVMVDAVMAPWDTAALAPVITEAGGVFTDWNGAPTAFGDSSIATNAALATVARRVLQVAR